MRKIYEHLDTLVLEIPDRPAPTGGCPSDEELEEMLQAAEEQQIERDAWYRARQLGCEWEARET